MCEIDDNCTQTTGEIEWKERMQIIRNRIKMDSMNSDYTTLNELPILLNK